MKINPWLALVVGILAGLAINKWNCNGGPDKELQIVRDSLHSMSVAKSFVDSNYNLLQDSYNDFFMWAMDSIKVLNHSQDSGKTAVAFTNMRIRNLIDETKALAQANNDTALMARALRAELLYNQKNREVEYVFATGDKKDSIYSAEVATCREAVEKRDSLYHRLSGLYDSLHAVSLFTVNKAEKLARQNKKRFVVGPYIGVTYESNFKPSYGIGITYQLFKF